MTWKGGREGKVSSAKSTDGHRLKMKDLVSSCTYNLLYQDLKRFSKNGEYFCKELMTVFQQRSELEINYAKGMQKLAGKLIKASKEMANNSTTYHAWSQISNEMFSTADIHRTLGNALQQDAILEIRQILDEHTKRKRPLDGAIDKTGKLVITNCNEQLKVKKKLMALTREHEALFSFVENSKQISTEKEKQKMLNRLTKSAELQAKVDEEYFNINMEGHQMRLKWENTLKNCYHIIQELEKQRIEILSNILNKYGLHMSSFGQTLLHCQKQIEQATRTVDMEKDLQSLVDKTSVTAEDNKAEFLMADYFEEDSKTVMGRERRKDAMKTKLQRLEDYMAKTEKDREGLEKMVKTYTENPSFSNKKNLEETEQLLDEITLKLDLLVATHCKLSVTVAEIEGKPKSQHKFSNSITKWKDKDYEHSVVQLSRPVRIKTTSLRSRQSLRKSMIYKGPAKSVLPQESESTSGRGEPEPLTPTQESGLQPSRALNGGTRSDEEITEGEPHSLGKCRALYDFTSDREDELNMMEGDLLDIFQRDGNDWWYGALNGQRGHFPATYVEELLVLNDDKTSDA
ncbi:nostrin [Clupea harengus]|uniref:Osteoclast-stimulating factor 1 n=1 Tax=Clupea harengus TaxID=7950 RepID=A0A6P3W830_CLUHA|nr:nostrin [Clupea harengus]